jgi:hypothetical protein
MTLQYLNGHFIAIVFPCLKLREHSSSSIYEQSVFNCVPNYEIEDEKKRNVT